MEENSSYSRQSNDSWMKLKLMANRPYNHLKLSYFDFVKLS